jgi:5-methylcytosine-specific restriction protein A
MPTAPPHVCRTCGHSGCTQHTRKPWTRAAPTPRIRGRRLQRMRKQLLDAHPLCVECLAQTPTRFTVAVIRDHTVPLAEGGRDDASNQQPLCQECSDRKTETEKQRGLTRSRDPRN